MTIPTKPHLRLRITASDPFSDDVDHQLRRFFRASLPEPWPACPRPAPEDVLPPVCTKALPSWLQLPVRIAITAAAACFVGGFVQLRSSFSDPQPTLPPMLGGPHFGLLRTIETTKSGQPVAVEIEQTPDSKTLKLRVQELPTAKQDQ